MKKILISGLGGSLFPVLHHKLKEKYCTVYVDNNPVIKKLYSDLNTYIVPAVLDPSYKTVIKEIINSNGIDIYLPLIDEEILIAHEIASEMKNIFLISPSLEFCNLSLNKFNLMRQLEKKRISHISSWTGDDFHYETDAVYFVKPLYGRGSRGVRTIRSREELEAYYLLERYKPNETLIQEKIGGTEYTVGMTTNSEDQILSFTPKKIISKKGITVEAIAVEKPNIFELCKKINLEFRPKGPINIQLFETQNGDLKVFEINPRFSTTSIMSFEAGIDEISLLLDHWTSKHFGPPLNCKEGLRLIRRWESLFYEN